MYKNVFKRLIDIVISFSFLALASPVFIIVTVWLHYVNHGDGAFFFQERPGKNEVIFKIIKFRSMNNRRDIQGTLLPDNDRITVIGRFIRKTSLDELPQLINVLKGDMSLVGPRPLLPEYLPYYTNDEKKRHLVRPGITGLAQINGRNILNWDKRFLMDIYYVDNLSFAMDFNIILKSFKKVLGQKDIGFLTGLNDLPLNIERNVHSEIYNK